MNAFSNLKPPTAASREAGDLLKALDALQPGGQQKKDALFVEAYPGIVRAIVRKVPQKDILAALSCSGLKLHPARYKEMLEAERKRRDERGERICCETCGAVIGSPLVETQEDSSQGGGA